MSGWDLNLGTRSRQGVYNRWTGLVDWTGGLDWTGLDWTGMDWNGLDSTQLKVSATILQLLESGYLLAYLCNFTQSCILLPSSACPYR